MAYSRKLENKTVARMVGIYCRDNHGSSNQLCPECLELQRYAKGRIEKCKFGEEKPVCSKCPVHCYKPAMRERIREVMKYSGPRMLWKSPFLALRHLYREFFKSDVKLK